MNEGRIPRIRQRLQESLNPLQLDIEDQSPMHIGHAGAEGGGHFHLTIVSERFSGEPPLARHRMVYEALGDLMKTDIHAVSIKAFAPEEINQND